MIAILVTAPLGAVAISVFAPRLLEAEKTKRDGALSVGKSFNDDIEVQEEAEDDDNEDDS